MARNLALLLFALVALLPKDTVLAKKRLGHAQYAQRLLKKSASLREMLSGRIDEQTIRAFGAVRGRDLQETNETVTSVMEIMVDETEEMEGMGMDEAEPVCAAFGEDNELSMEFTMNCVMELMSAFMVGTPLSGENVTDWCDESADSCLSQLNELVATATADGSENCTYQVQAINFFGTTCTKDPGTGEYCWIDTEHPMASMGNMTEDFSTEQLEAMCTPCFLEMFTQLAPPQGEGADGENVMNEGEMLCMQIDGTYCLSLMQEMESDDLPSGDVFCHPCMEMLASVSVMFGEESDDAAAEMQAVGELCTTTDEEGVRCYDKVLPIMNEDTDYCFSELENGINECYDNCTEYLTTVRDTAGCCVDALTKFTDIGEEPSSPSFYDFVTVTCGLELASCEAEVEEPEEPGVSVGIEPQLNDIEPTSSAFAFNKASSLIMIAIPVLQFAIYSFFG